MEDIKKLLEDEEPKEGDNPNEAELPGEQGTTPPDPKTLKAVEAKLDWKGAALHLKGVVAEMYTIDNYFRRGHIQELRERFNAKERTQELYNSIMAL